jgi:hypothetical protein
LVGEPRKEMKNGSRKPQQPELPVRELPVRPELRLHQLVVRLQLLRALILPQPERFGNIPCCRSARRFGSRPL